jgi:hypothetical protein
VAQAVNCLGDQLFPGACFAFDQHGGIDASQILDQLEYLPHARTFADDVRQCCVRVQLASQVDQRRDIVQKQDVSAVVARIVQDFDLQVPRPWAFLIQLERELAALLWWPSGEFEKGDGLLWGQRRKSVSGCPAADASFIPAMRQAAELENRTQRSASIMMVPCRCASRITRRFSWLLRSSRSTVSLYSAIWIAAFRSLGTNGFTR